MKRTIKNYLKLGVLLLGISFSLINCEKDFTEDITNPQNLNSKLKFETLNFEQVKSNPRVAEKLKKLFPKSKVAVNSSSAREIYNAEYDFTVNTDVVKYIENSENNSHSYTFQITRENQDVNILENLVLVAINGGDYSARLTRYYLNNEQRQELENDNHISTYYHTETEQLEGDFSQYVRIADCTTSIQTYHITPAGNEYEFVQGSVCHHTEPGDMCTIHTVITIDCDSIPGGASTGPGTSGTTTDGSDVTTGNPGSSTTNDGTTTSNNTDTTSGSDTSDGFDENGEVIINTTPVLINDPVATPEDDDCNTSKEDLMIVFPNMTDADAELLANLINDKGQDYGIDTKEELWHFLAQTGHETGGFTTLQVTENLHYSVTNLLTVWPTRFSLTDSLKLDPNDYKFDAEKLANYAYCCRMGNGNEASEDGWKYRGRGIKQLTGKTNYTGFKTFYNNNFDPDIDPVANPNLISTNDTLAILSGLWYYKKRVLNKITVDSTTTVEKVTWKINGGYTGLADRKVKFNTIKDTITCK